jgi:hypothetical protein
MILSDDISSPRHSLAALFAFPDAVSWGMSAYSGRRWFMAVFDTAGEFVKYVDSECAHVATEFL